MANKKLGEQIQDMLQAEDQQGRLLMAEYICELRETNDPNLEIKEQVVREAMRRLGVHGLEDFDVEVEALMKIRREGRG